MAKIKLHTPILDMSSDTYHGVPGTVSSSQLKDLLEDPQVFHDKYISKKIPRVDIPAFALGTYVHSAILEPHNLLNDCAVFPGKARRGKEWDAFKEEHSGKAIITATEEIKCQKWVETGKESEITMGYINNSTPEVSMFVTLLVCHKTKTIYSKKRFWKLTETGWDWGDYSKDFTEDMVTLIVKVRADALGKEDFVADIKTTTGNARNRKEMQAKIDYYQYDLSASLYLDMFTLGLEIPYETFIWSFISKDHLNCRSYAASEGAKLMGRRKYMTALLTLAERMKNDWEEVDFLDVLGPSMEQVKYYQN